MLFWISVGFKSTIAMAMAETGHPINIFDFCIFSWTPSTRTLDALEPRPGPDFGAWGNMEHSFARGRAETIKLRSASSSWHLTSISGRPCLGFSARAGLLWALIYFSADVAVCAFTATRVTITLCVCQPHAEVPGGLPDKRWQGSHLPSQPVVQHDA